MSDTSYNVARNGEKLGAFTLADIAAGLASGHFKEGDFYWTSGMANWEPISNLMPKLAEIAAAAQKAKAEAEARAKAEAAAAAAAAKPAPAAAPAPAPAARPAPAASAAAKPAAAAWECLSCKVAFAAPVEPKSGYATIRRAIILGASAFGSIIVGSILAAILSQFGLNIVAGIVALVAVIVFLVLLFMFAFEFISSAVHHGIYRAGALKRCPCCSSNLIKRAG